MSAAKYNTGRTGWNTRGGTDAEHLAIQRQIRAEENSPAWARKYVEACAELEALIGNRATDAWLEHTWPGTSIERYTWKELADAVRAKIEQTPADYGRLWQAAVEIDVAVQL